MISATLTAVEVDKKKKKGPSGEASEVEYSISLPKQHRLVYKGVWELSG
jgi:hypothetical protein